MLPKAIAAPRILPRDQRNGPSVDLLQPPVDLRSPGLCSVLIDFGVEALQQAVNQGGSRFDRQADRVLQQISSVLCHISIITAHHFAVGLLPIRQGLGAPASCAPCEENVRHCNLPPCITRSRLAASRAPPGPATPPGGPPR